MLSYFVQRCNRVHFPIDFRIQIIFLSLIKKKLKAIESIGQIPFCLRYEQTENSVLVMRKVREGRGSVPPEGPSCRQPWSSAADG